VGEATLRDVNRGTPLSEAGGKHTATESEVLLTEVVTSLSVLIGVAVLTPRNRNAATLIARKVKNLIACDGSRVHKERE
jgi:hypothetical protein